MTDRQWAVLNARCRVGGASHDRHGKRALIGLSVTTRWETRWNDGGPSPTLTLPYLPHAAAREVLRRPDRLPPGLRESGRSGACLRSLSSDNRVPRERERSISDDGGLRGLQLCFNFASLRTQLCKKSYVNIVVRKRHQQTMTLDDVISKTM